MTIAVYGGQGVTRPKDALPDDQDRAVFDGVTVRKGTVAAMHIPAAAA